MKYCKSKVYRDDVVRNKNKYKTANNAYQSFYVQNNKGEWLPCLMTEHELEVGCKRASKNQEDLKPLKKSWFGWFK